MNHHGNRRLRNMDDRRRNFRKRLGNPLEGNGFDTLNDRRRDGGGRFQFLDFLRLNWDFEFERLLLRLVFLLVHFRRKNRRFLEWLRGSPVNPSAFLRRRAQEVTHQDAGKKAAKCQDRARQHQAVLPLGVEIPRHDAAREE
jgi:hypothetical protein